MKQIHIQLIFLFILIAVCSETVHAQDNNQSLYESFDNTIGKKNLGINNGTIHINNLRPADKTHRYYNTDKYTIGNIIYDGQPYTAIALKYDLLDDVVVAKVSGESNLLGINLITEKTESFFFNAKKFTNLSYHQNNAKFVGFYEEENIGNQIAFYTKYKKKNIEVLRNTGVFYTFTESNTFVLKYNGNFYKLASKSDAIAAFPTLENDIDTFYVKNTALENSGKQLFYRTLLKHLGQLLPNETN